MEREINNNFIKKAMKGYQINHIQIEDWLHNVLYYYDATEIASAQKMFARIDDSETYLVFYDSNGKPIEELTC